ncbi:MAG: TonB-dependent receptor [Candidatus Kapaibacteriota bacterium]
MLKKFTTLVLAVVLFTTSLLAEGTIKGTVKSADGDEVLPGASVAIVGTKLGAKTNSNGVFEITSLKPGKYTLRASYIGYSPMDKTISLKENETVTVNFSLGAILIESEAISVVASRAQTRETPVAFSNISKMELENQLGSRDIPLILNTTPGVYATDLGGGYGDSRINIRGFDQRNISVMINGVPVNDMENGWVYWSNWDGLGDVTSSIQVQRGLGASRIINPSVGGTMNIITDAAYQRAGIKLKQEFASGNFLKTTLIGNTGKIGDFAATIAAVRKTADGVVEKAWDDAWAYYLGMSYDINQNHKLDFYVIGAPQMHGQRYFQPGIATFDKQLAKDYGVRQGLIDSTIELGYTANKDWGAIKIDPAHPVKEYYYGSEHDLHDNSYINTRSNYFHKPQMNLNWFWKFSDVTSLTSVFYYSIGRGGGSAPSGIAWDSLGRSDIQGAYNFNIDPISIDPKNDPNLHKAKGYLMNSINQHNWYGYLGTVDIKSSKELTIQTGLDLRSYTGEHWQEVRNLLGADYVYNTSDKTLDYKNNPSLALKKLGDKINYHYDANVIWYGGFFQTEYKKDELTAYLNTSISNTGYKRLDYFRTDTMPNGRETAVQNFLGYTAKVGANYNLNRSMNVFANFGYYNRAPLYRNVFNNDNSLYSNINNEKVTSMELGYSYFDRSFRANLNLYWTIWKDRSWYTSTNYTDPVTHASTTYYYNLPGLGANHKGVELDFSWRIIKQIRINGMISIGDWRWTNDVTATYTPENLDTTFVKYVYAKDLKVGDAAQTTGSITINYYPINKTSLSLTYTYFADYYANFSPENRNDPNDRTQPWKLPSYGNLDFHFNMTLPVDLPFDLVLSAHGYNLLDSKYVADAYDPPTHDANATRVWVGLPLRWNVGLQIVY